MAGNKSKLLNLGSLFVQLLAVMFLTIITGCGDDGFSDLQQYINQVKARPKGTIEPLPEPKPIEPFVFKPEGLRDPFKAISETQESEDSQIAIGNGIKPDFTRRKEELEAYPLDALRMVGTIVKKGNLWGLIKASDKTIYRVQTGNHMGKNYGRIIRIMNDKIELMEIVPDKPGSWREQQTSLALTE
jgi:type IV pilus assembly protein PilP